MNVDFHQFATRLDTYGPCTLNCKASAHFPRGNDGPQPQTRLDSSYPSLCSENSTRFVWGTDDPEGFFTGYGWEGVQARQYGDPSIAAGWPLGDDEMRRAARPR
jgi:hypothetical protein